MSEAVIAKMAKSAIENAYNKHTRSFDYSVLMLLLNQCGEDVFKLAYREANIFNKDSLTTTLSRIEDRRADV